MSTMVTGYFNAKAASVDTVGVALRRAVAALRETSPSARLDAEALVTHITGFGRTELMTRDRHPLSVRQTTDLFRLVERRATGEPIAYLTKKREFWSLELLVSPATLIPRPETEVLVEQALTVIPTHVAWAVADLGTGSGAIALALAKERPLCQVIAIDSVPAALDVARENARRHKLTNVEFLQGSWFKPLDARVHIIVSNPPYIRIDDPHLTSSDVRFEPHHALSGGADGLDPIRHIVTHAKDCLYPGGMLLLEHGYDQGIAVCALMQHHGYVNIACHQDIACRDRVSVCQVR